MKLLFKWWTLHYAFDKASASSEMDASLVSLLKGLPVLMRSKSTRVKTYRRVVALKGSDVGRFSAKPNVCLQPRNDSIGSPVKRSERVQYPRNTRLHEPKDVKLGKQESLSHAVDPYIQRSCEQEQRGDK